MHIQPIILGFAIFAMFFGSGNLVFPLKIGQEAGSGWYLGFVGLFISGIILPFLGVFAIKRYKGSYQAFFNDLGPGANILVPLICLSLLGSFGVVPRCITVAFGGVQVLYPAMPLWVFSAGFCVLCFLVGLKDNRMIGIISKFMTPIKLSTLGAIILYAIAMASPAIPNLEGPLATLELGLHQGYQTMDLVAGFFFSSLIFNHILRNLPQGMPAKKAFWYSVQASLVGAFIISLAYLGLVYIGATYGSLLMDTPPTQMLPTLCFNLLGTSSTVLIAICMGFSCLTTAIALNNLFAHFLHKQILAERIPFLGVLALSTLTAFLISLLNFKGITTFLGPILEVIYPGLIAFSIMSLIHPRQHWIKVATFYGLTIAFLIHGLF